MQKLFTSKWPPYVSGPIFAGLFIISFFILNTPIGISDGYQLLSESIESRSFHNLPPLVWQTGFLGGIFVGALLASLFGKNWKIAIFPEDTSAKEIFTSFWVTPVQGIIGGFCIMLGLLIAGDSFLGQWAAAMRLSTGAWIFIFSIVLWGVIFRGLMAAKITPPSIEKQGGGEKSGKSAEQKK